MSDKKKRWEKVSALLDKAMSLPAEERQSWLEEACHGDDEILAEVLSLLEYDAEKTGGIRASVRSLAEDLGSSDESIYLGQKAGNYRISKKLAEGGMGSVFLADHAAGDFDRRVAVKLLPKQLLKTDAARRFVEERRILAGLKHPNIASLIDGGTLPDGVPYIVMDYIDGKTIDAYCASGDVDNDEIIDLACKICDAVDYAHRKLVIHRDIKPSNIIVDKRGEPMLLDFGIAKLVQPDALTAHETQAEQRVLTPMYASPEQVEGLPITTAADVYGIGLLLYRLLTGQMPYAATGTNARELEQAILSQTPEKPSAAVSEMRAGQGSARWKQRQQRALRGELDTILLTALRKTPERRYPSVAALAEDLRRFRQGRPIVARKDSPIYVARKFVSRNRWPVGVVSAAVLSAIGLGAYYTQALKLERDTAEQTAAFLSNVFEASDPYRKNRDGLTVQALLDAGLGKLENDQSLAPLVRARLLTTIALVQRNLGNNARAETLASEALEIIEAQRGENDAAMIAPLSVMARIRTRAGDYPGANQYAGRMLAIAKSEHGEHSAQAAQATHLLSTQAYRSGDIDSMGNWANRTYNIRKAIYPDNDMAIAVGANSLALYHWQRGHLLQARELYAESANIQAAQTERNEVQYAGLLHNLGLLYNDTGDYAKAAETYKESVRIRKAAATERDAYLPLTLYALAHTRTRLGRYPQAYRSFREAIPLQTAIAGRDQHLVAYALTGFGMMLEEVGELEESAPILQEANRIFESVFDEPHQDQTPTWIGLARLAQHKGEFDSAQQLIDQAITLRTNIEGPDDLGTLRAHNALGQLHFTRGNYADAIDTLEQTLGRYDAIGQSDHPFAIEAVSWLGRSLIVSGRATEGIALLREAQRQGEKDLPADHKSNLLRRIWIAEALISGGDQENGQAMLQSARMRLTTLEQQWKTAIKENPIPALELLFELPET